MTETIVSCQDIEPKSEPICFKGFCMMGSDEPDEMVMKSNSIVMNWKTNDGYFKIRPNNAPNQMIFSKEKKLRVASWFKTIFLSEDETGVDFMTATVEDENETFKKMDLLHNERGPAFISNVGERPIYYYYLNGSGVNLKMSKFFEKNGIDYINGEKVSEEDFALFVMNCAN